RCPGLRRAVQAFLCPPAPGGPDMRRARLLWLTPLALAACAHEKVTEAPPAPPVVAQPAPPVADASDKDKANDTAELQRILSGPIAHFEFDKAQLTEQDRQKLQTLAKAMKAHSAARIRIAGNCDELGTVEYNLALGQRRAEVARKYLVELGVEGTRVDTISYGEEHPVAAGDDAESHAANRRDGGAVVSTRGTCARGRRPRGGAEGIGPETLWKTPEPVWSGRHGRIRAPATAAALPAHRARPGPGLRPAGGGERHRPVRGCG